MNQEGTYVPLSGLSECRNHVNFETYLDILFIAHHFHYCPLSLLVVSTCLLHGVQMANSCHCHLIDSHTLSGNFVPFIHLPTLYKLLDEVRTLLNPQFSVYLGSGTVPTLRNKYSTYHYGITPSICVIVYRFMDKISPTFLISSISHFSMLENPL